MLSHALPSVVRSGYQVLRQPYSEEKTFCKTLCRLDQMQTCTMSDISSRDKAFDEQIDIHQEVAKQAMVRLVVSAQGKDAVLVKYVYCVNFAKG